MKQSVIYLIFSLFVVNILAQTGNQAFQFAMNQYEKGNYQIAAKEFNRAVFLGTNETFGAYLHIARSYSNNGMDDLADIFYDKAYFANTDDSIKTNVLLEKAFTLVKRKKFSSAYYELVNVDSLYGEQQLTDFWFFLGVTYYGMDNYEHSQVCFAMNQDSTATASLDERFSYLNKMLKRHRPGRVETMSFILPGLGQFHTGNIKAGINSMALLGGIFYGMVQIGLIYSPFDGLFLFAPWFQRYYMGGAEKAKHMAIHKQQEIKNDVFNEILDITQ